MNSILLSKLEKRYINIDPQMHFMQKKRLILYKFQINLEKKNIFAENSRFW